MFGTDENGNLCNNEVPKQEAKEDFSKEELKRIWMPTFEWTYSSINGIKYILNSLTHNNIRYELIHLEENDLIVLYIVKYNINEQSRIYKELLKNNANVNLDFYTLSKVKATMFKSSCKITKVEIDTSIVDVLTIRVNQLFIMFLNEQLNEL